MSSLTQLSDRTLQQPCNEKHFCPPSLYKLVGQRSLLCQSNGRSIQSGRTYDGNRHCAKLSACRFLPLLKILWPGHHTFVCSNQWPPSWFLPQILHSADMLYTFADSRKNDVQLGLRLTQSLDLQKTNLSKLYHTPQESRPAYELQLLSVLESESICVFNVKQYWSQNSIRHHKRYEGGLGDASNRMEALVPTKMFAGLRSLWRIAGDLVCKCSIPLAIAFAQLAIMKASKSPLWAIPCSSSPPKVPFGQNSITMTRS